MPVTITTEEKPRFEMEGGKYKALLARNPNDPKISIEEINGVAAGADSSDPKVQDWLLKASAFQLSRPDLHPDERKVLQFIHNSTKENTMPVTIEGNKFVPVGGGEEESRPRGRTMMDKLLAETLSGQQQTQTEQDKMIADKASQPGLVGIQLPQAAQHISVPESDTNAQWRRILAPGQSTSFMYNGKPYKAYHDPNRRRVMFGPAEQSPLDYEGARQGEFKEYEMVPFETLQEKLG